MSKAAKSALFVLLAVAVGIGMLYGFLNFLVWMGGLEL